jgi:restriction system protein
MSGRGDKGLLITTGSFTADTKQAATRDGVPPVDQKVEISAEFFSDV